MKELGFGRGSKYWESPAFLDLPKPSINGLDHNNMASSFGERMKIEDASEDIKNTTAIDWIFGNFLRILMIPILGTDYDSPMMWSVLYKPGAKDRIQIEYISSNTRHQLTDAIDRLVGLQWSLGGRLFVQEPILSAMQGKLYLYPKEEEVSYGGD